MKYDELTDRELDDLVAEKIFDDSRMVHLYQPAHHIEHAFKVVEAMRERGHRFALESGPDWCVSIAGNDVRVEDVIDICLPRAICIAALRACDE